MLLGIDPGLHGALAFLDMKASQLITYNMPTHQRGAKNIVDEVALATIMRSHPTTKACLENVFSMPEDGHVGAFSFGRSKGVVEGVLAALQIPLVLVTPAQWKRDLKTNSNKGHTKALARALFPRHRNALSNEGKCEAAMIALWLHLHQ